MTTTCGCLYNKGINRIDLKTGRVKNYVSRPGDSTGIDDSNIFAITRLSTGELLFATPIGVNVYNAAEDNFTRIPQLVNVFVKSMLEDLKAVLPHQDEVIIPTILIMKNMVGKTTGIVLQNLYPNTIMNR